MYYHIEKAKYLKISVEKKTFIALQKGKVQEICINISAKTNTAFQAKHEFLRAVWKDCYIDLSIANVIQTNCITVQLGSIIDYYKPHK